MNNDIKDAINELEDGSFRNRVLLFKQKLNQLDEKITVHRAGTFNIDEVVRESRSVVNQKKLEYINAGMVRLQDLPRIKKELESLANDIIVSCMVQIDKKIVQLKTTTEYLVKDNQWLKKRMEELTKKQKEGVFIENKEENDGDSTVTEKKRYNYPRKKEDNEDRFDG